MNSIVVGLDLSVNHLAAVIISSVGAIDECVTDIFCVNANKYAKICPDIVCALPKREKDEDLHNYSERRKCFISSTLLRRISRHADFIVNDKVYVSLENYAFGAQSRAITPIAELTGIIKQDLWMNGAKIRLHDPSSLKKFATGKGNANKLEMINSAAANGCYIPNELYQIKSKTVRKKEVLDADGPGTDIADAFWLAKMLCTELNVRSGQLSLEHLPGNKRELFLRVTKSSPVNLLARPFIEKTLSC